MCGEEHLKFQPDNFMHFESEVFASSSPSKKFKKHQINGKNANHATNVLPPTQIVGLVTQTPSTEVAKESGVL